ncbi:MAG: hypothetical protein P4L93_00905 [Coriobacteriia bacterium]|nr:hypothetical protein [Coriobacteriia bacterium]
MSRARWIARLSLAVVLALAALSVVACGPSKAEIAQQQKDECFATMSQMKLAIDLVNADTGVYPDVASVVAQLHAKCPSGGTYSFDPNTNVVSCSVHGHP